MPATTFCTFAGSSASAAANFALSNVNVPSRSTVMPTADGRDAVDG